MSGCHWSKRELDTVVYELLKKVDDLEVFVHGSSCVNRLLGIKPSVVSVDTRIRCLEDTLDKCPKCHGTGKVLQPTGVNNTDGVAVHGWSICPRCEGTGKRDN